MCPGIGQEEWLRCFAPPFGGVCRGHGVVKKYPAFAPDTLFLPLALQKWQLGFWSFCILLSIICPNCACTHLFLVPHSFFVFCCSRIVQVQALQQRVPACLRSTKQNKTNHPIDGGDLKGTQEPAERAPIVKAGTI